MNHGFLKEALTIEIDMVKAKSFVDKFTVIVLL